MDNVDVLGVHITSEPLQMVTAEIKKVLERDERKARYVCATSVHGVIEAQSDLGLKNILNNAFINHPDGLPLAKVGRLLGAKRIEQIKGPDLFPHVCKMTASMDVKHFFYGGQEGVAETLARRMQKRFPGLKVVGTYCPPFRPLTAVEKKEVVQQINESGADIVWVGLSTPKQEKWIGEFHDKLNVKVLFSVGAAFDVHTGRIAYTTPWVHRLGLEWLYRLILEPRRLWKRYLKIVPSFIVLVGLQLMKLKTFDNERS